MPAHPVGPAAAPDGAPASATAGGRTAAPTCRHPPPSRWRALPGVLRAALGHSPSRRWGLVATAVVWLVFALTGGAGLVQYAPDGWVVPVGQWQYHSWPTPYWFYALSDHWAVVPVPWFLARALLVALPFGLYVALSSYGRTCRPAGRRGQGVTGLAGLALGALGMASCCSPVALVLVGALGSGVATFLTGSGTWLALAVVTPLVVWTAWRLAAAEAPGQAPR